MFEIMYERNNGRVELLAQVGTLTALTCVAPALAKQYGALRIEGPFDGPSAVKFYRLEGFSDS